MLKVRIWAKVSGSQYSTFPLTDFDKTLPFANRMQSNHIPIYIVLALTTLYNPFSNISCHCLPIKRTYPGRVKSRLQYPALIGQHDYGFLRLRVTCWDGPFTDLSVVAS